MKKTAEVRVERSMGDLNVVLRRLTHVVRRLGEGDSLRQAIDSWLEALSSATGRNVRLEALASDGTLADGVFQRSELSAPVTSASGLGGLLAISPTEHERAYGVQDVQFLGTLADLLSVMQDLSLNVADDQAATGLLARVFDQVPLGVVAFSGQGRQIVFNARAKSMLEGTSVEGRDMLLAFLAQRGGVEIDELSRGACIVPVDRGAIVVRVHEIAASSSASCTVVVLADLDRNEQEMLKHLECEIYRQRWLGSPLSVAVIETSGDPAALLAHVPEVQHMLHDGEVCGLLGTRRMGLVLPGRTQVQALGAARSVCRQLSDTSLMVGCAVLEGAADQPRSLVERAVAALEPSAELIRPRILVVDRSPAVQEAMGLFLREFWEIESTNHATEALRRLESVPVDAVMIEHEPEVGVSGLDLLAKARALQPGVAGLLTSTRLGFRDELPADLENVGFVGKPFAVGMLRSTLTSLLEGGASPSPPR